MTNRPPPPGPKASGGSGAGETVGEACFPVASTNMRTRAIRICWLAFRISLDYFLYTISSFFLSRDRGKRWKETLHKKNALRLQQTALSLKGLLIKVGQFMSARVDLLPESYTQTLSLLQDQVPPAPFPEIKARFIEELGASPSSIFRTFNEIPIASASLGQVHEATLKPLQSGSQAVGARVAVKIQYPQIESIVETDLKAIRSIIWVVQKIFPRVRFDILYSEFSKIVHQELNYVDEAHHAEQFRKNFEGDDRIIVPKVIWPFTTKRVLTLQFVEGIKINRFDKIREAGIDTTSVATLLVESYMKQILQHRFFHGDPHPGNLFVQPGPRLVFVDFGLMQAIPPSVHRGIEKMIIAIIDRDISGITHALLDLGFIARSEKIADVENVVRFFMDRYRDMSPRSFKTITITQVAQDLETLFQVYPSLQIPNHFILFGRTAGMLNGLCSQLDPSLNIIELAKPHAKKFISPSDWTSEIFSRGREIISSLLELPVALRTLVDLSNRGHFKTEMHSEDLTQILSKIYRLAYRTILTAFIVAMTLLHRNFIHDYRSLEGILLGISILLSSLILFLSFFRRR
ncbi:MAG: AarF/UbiB family protein [Nitrospira sp.]|nr:AarF/ABC1/UbiB kinase family protein [Candidatus Manganitrophaceae bacterium]HIL34774.1 AarF/ABC1/UbiB kinase family protein [Candidatus Manganitrophaceae bacterium]